MIERIAVCFTLGAILIAGRASGAGDCEYKGVIYSSGAAVCQSGTQYRCDEGRWNGLGVACTESLAVSVRACEFKGTPYVPGATSCQSGTLYRCDDGAWVSLAIACTANGQSAWEAPLGHTFVHNRSAERSRSLASWEMTS
jgi:hypothetical protein